MVYQVVQDRDSTKHFMHVSETVEQLNGVSAADVLRDPMALYDQVLEEDRVGQIAAERNSAEKMSVFDEVLRLRHHDGQLRWMHFCAAPRHLEDGRIIWDGVEIDITERKLAEETIHNNAARFHFMLETSPIAVRIVGSAGRKVLFANQRYADMCHAARNQIIGSDPTQIYANPKDYDDILQKLDNGLSITDQLLELKIPTGGTTWVLASFATLEYEGKQTNLGWFYDVTNIKEAESKIQQMAFHDALTQLPNRLMLIERLNQALAASSRNAQYGAVLFIDLDNFKIINDTKGHITGDLLLIEVAKRPQSSIR